MKVKATRMGYYHHKRIKEGEVFVLNKDTDFSEKWMENVEGSAKVTVAAPIDEAPKSPKKGWRAGTEKSGVI